MMYSEFLKLANLTEKEISFDFYTESIEPAYRELPGWIVSDKESFVKWYKKNTELCRFISEKVIGLDTMNREYCKAEKARQEAEKKVEERQHSVEMLVQSNTLLAHDVLVLKLRAAFAPEELTKEMRLAFFDEYENAKATAKELGII